MKTTSLTTLFACGAIGLLTMGAAARAVAAPIPTSHDSTQASIAQLLAWQAQGSLSCTQIARQALARVRQRDPALKAFIALNPRLLDQAAGLDRLRRGGEVRPLHCVPVAVKDNLDVRGMPTTGGSRLLARNLPTADATAVQRLRDAGALVVGKTNLDELAVAGSTISSLKGQTLNAYDATRFAAGSSGGSAVAVATGMATCALGTETVNSLRNPASAESIVAMRSSHGVVSRVGAILQSSSMDVVGPLCRSVDDVARLLTTMAGRDLADPETLATESLPAPLHPVQGTQPLRGLRLGVLRNLFGQDAEHALVNTALEAAFQQLRQQGVELVEISSTEFDSSTSSSRLNVANHEFKGLFEAYLQRLPAGSVTTVKGYVAAGEFPAGTMGGFLKNAGEWKNPLGRPEYAEARRYADTLRTRLVEMMETQHLDALAYPAQKRPPLALDDKPRPERNGIFASALGLPAIDLPAGFTPAQPGAPVGLPIGLDLLGRPYADQRLLEMAAAIEQLLRARRPPAD